jgi:hypothetical protein
MSFIRKKWSIFVDGLSACLDAVSATAAVYDCRLCSTDLEAETIKPPVIDRRYSKLPSDDPVRGRFIARTTVA